MAVADPKFVQKTRVEAVSPIDNRILYWLGIQGARITQRETVERRIVYVHLRVTAKNVVIVRHVVVDFKVALITVELATAVRRVVRRVRNVG